MKFIGGTSYFDYNEQTWKSNPRIYTDFHCNMKEWKQLSKGKYYFIAQLLNKVIEQNKYDYKTVKLKNGLEYKHIEFNDEKQDEQIIHDCIKLVTNREAEIWINHGADEFYLSIDKIHFKDYDDSMPLISFSDVYYIGETTYIMYIGVILEAIYTVLTHKTYDSFNHYYKKYYNSNYYMEFQTDYNVNGFGLYNVKYDCKFYKSSDKTWR